MPTYLIKMPHTEAECLNALDEVPQKAHSFCPRYIGAVVREIIPAMQSWMQKANLRQKK